MERGGRHVSQQSLDELRELMERTDAGDEKIEQVLKIAAANPDTFEELLEVYSLKAAQVATKDAFYPYETIQGAYVIGEDPDGSEVGLTREQVNEHLLVVGMTGRGKTTFFYNLIDLVEEDDLPYMVFDFKNDYRHLVENHEVLVLNWRDLKFNPLEPPPGVTPGNWGEILSDTFAHATDLLIGSESYFLEKLSDLYDLYDVEESGRYPSLFELKELVGADQVSKASPKFRYKERVDSRLSIMTGFSGEIFDCSSGFSIEDLVERNVVFELKEPNQFVTNFFVEAVLTWIYYYRDAAGHRGRLRHAVLFDEAKRVFDVNRERQPESGFPPIDDLVGKVREFGEGLVVADHEPSKLTDSIKANTNIKLWLTLGSGEDVQEMARTYGLDEDQVEFARNMGKGEGLIKIADRPPVPMQIPENGGGRTLDDDELRERMRSHIDALTYEESFRPPEFLAAIGKEEDEEFSSVTESLLASVNEHPFMSMSERYDAIDVGSKKGNAAKNELLKLDLVKEVEVVNGRPGRNPKLLDLTKKGREALEDRGYPVEETGRRGIAHRWWQRTVKEHYEERGYDVSVEHPIGDQRIDVYATREGETVAVEVAMSPEHEVENVRKCVEEDVERIIVAYRDEDVGDKIRLAVEEELGEPPDLVEYVPLTDFS